MIRSVEILLWERKRECGRRLAVPGREREGGERAEGVLSQQHSSGSKGVGEDVMAKKCMCEACDTRPHLTPACNVLLMFPTRWLACLCCSERGALVLWYAPPVVVFLRSYADAPYSQSMACLAVFFNSGARRYVSSSGGKRKCVPIVFCAHFFWGFRVSLFCCWIYVFQTFVRAEIGPGRKRGEKSLGGIDL